MTAAAAASPGRALTHASMPDTHDAGRGTGSLPLSLLLLCDSPEEPRRSARLGVAVIVAEEELVDVGGSRDSAVDARRRLGCRHPQA